MRKTIVFMTVLMFLILPAVGGVTILQDSLINEDTNGTVTMHEVSAYSTI
ncbi:hypothetical protein GS399_11060 [Pedobacter sp. HMF7647]|uniref:Uncharacterized protein n=1 Tax=Hufsiella arboris TaxID=2695275 RepID=A0A7K1YAQ9_9SPHI|nr:hypothetical protein [Hufsiella arboris]MXV51510.1 hypothetical protein [Hufsiella arboris]